MLSRDFSSKLSLLFILSFLFVNSDSFAQLSGTYTVGSGGSYATIAAAIAALNTSGVSGPVVFSLTDATYSETGANLRISVTSNAPSSANTVTFKPATGVSPIITITGCDATYKTGFMIVGTSYVTIDGSNTVGGTTKDLTFRMNDGTNGLYGMAVTGASNNVTLKNFNLDFAAKPTTDCYGIQVDGPSSVPSNITIINVAVGNSNIANSPYYGIYVYAASGGFSNYQISNCEINATNRGFLAWVSATPSGSSIEFSRNTVSMLTTSSGITYGFYIISAVGTFNITKNRFHTLGNSGTNSITGIYGSGMDGTVMNINNNFFGGNITAGSSVAGVSLLRWTSNTLNNIYHNTFKINSDGNALATTKVSSCIDITGNSTIKNNIFINERNGSNDYLIRNAGTATIDYNNFVGASSQIGNRGTNAITENVFLTSATDFHLTGTSIGNTNLSGTSSTSITTDIDGQTRHATNPYMGADENTDSPLPIELVSFSGTRVEAGIELRWATASEVDAYAFEVEVSTDKGLTFSKIGEVAARGNSNIAQNYVYVVKDAPPVASQYRLKMIDVSGAYEFSNTIEVGESEVPARFALEQNYPNPFNPATSIPFSLPSQEVVKVTVFSGLGEEVAALANGTFEAGSHTLSFDASHLPSGIYWYTITAGAFTSTKKMVLMK